MNISNINIFNNFAQNRLCKFVKAHPIGCLAIATLAAALLYRNWPSPVNIPTIPVLERGGGISQEADPSHKPIMNLLASARGIKTLNNHIFSFLEPKEIAAVERTSKFWQESTLPCWKTLCIREKMIPEMSSPESYKKIFKNLYPDSFGPQFYKDYMGDIDSIPEIPQNYIQRSTDPDLFERGLIKDTHQLVLIPAFITIQLSAESSLTLDDQERLVENPGAKGVERKIRVPVTINNISMIGEKCLKKGFRAKIIPKDHWITPDIERSGNRQVHTHWFYPRKDPIGFNQDFQQQLSTAANANLEVPSIFDTAIYYLLREIHTGKKLNREKIRTLSTIDTEFARDALRFGQVYPATLFYSAEPQLGLIPNPKYLVYETCANYALPTIGIAASISAKNS